MKDLKWLKSDYIAHRGLHTLDKRVPENSMKAFSLAIENNYSIECDLNILKDNEIVVFHDSNLKRMCGEKKDLDQLSKEEIKTYKLLDTEERIPTLLELLELVDSKVNLLIEIKNKHCTKTLKYALKILENYKGNYAIFSFHPKVPFYLRLHHKDIPRGQIAGAGIGSGEKIKFLTKLANNLAFNFLTRPHFVSYNYSGMPNKKLDKYYKKNIVIGWTVRNKEDFIKARSLYDNIVFEFFKPNM
jgi:glycerophosphoryl diester phosphodiesterase